MKKLNNKELLETNGGSPFPIPTWLQPLADYLLGIPKEEQENFNNGIQN